MTTWQYLTSRFIFPPAWIDEFGEKGQAYIDAEIDVWLNKLGAAGWELCSAVQFVPWQAWATFKRSST